jgi:predicted transcriptional regulator
VLQACYSPFVTSSTSSFRIPDELKARLDQAAEQMEKGKNWIINRALEEYLERHSQEALQAEARRQSLAASRHKWKDGEFWERMAVETWNE